MSGPTTEPPATPGGDRPDDGDVGAAPIGTALDRVLRSLGRGDLGPGASAPGSPGAMVALAGRWEEAVGAPLAARCRPAELSDGVLVVVVDDPAYIPELRYSGASIAEGANRVLGAPVVTRVEVRRRR